MGSGRGRRYAVRPAPVITSAVSRAKTPELWRASYPTTDPRPWPVATRWAASPAAARVTTTRFIRFGPAPSAPRAGPRCRTPACRRTGRRGRRVAAALDLREDRLELGSGLRVGSSASQPRALSRRAVTSTVVMGGHDTGAPPFTFSGRWEVPAELAQVHDLLVDLEHYPDWWPQVVAVASLGPDDARVVCRSDLPHTLDLVLHAVDRSPERLEVAVDGDLEGWVRFDLTPVPAAPASSSPRW